MEILLDLVHISDEVIQEYLSVADFLSSCDEAFRLYGTGELLNPSRQETVREGFFRLELPGEWTGRYRARKVIEEWSDVATGRLGERTAVIELEDLRTGRTAVLDAEYITNMRTGAASALGVRYLGTAPVRTLAVLGTGRISKALALCADQALGPVEIRATSRKAENRAAFGDAVGPRVKAELRMVDSIAACVDGVDAILTAVPTPRPILLEADISDEVHLSVIGGDSRTAQLDVGLLYHRAVVVDHLEQAQQSGDFLAVQAEGRAQEIRYAQDVDGGVQTVGDAALGRLEGLRGTGAMVYLTGMAVQDLHAAVTVYERLVRG